VLQRLDARDGLRQAGHPQGSYLLLAVLLLLLVMLAVLLLLLLVV